MTTFLDIVVKDILHKHGTDLAQLTIVFPNKRASLFFNTALAEQCDGPVWSPRYTTISELFCQNSTLALADRITLVCQLYESYVKVTGSQETLDQFYPWGEMMLSDFDDIDKHLAPADKVFILLSNIHEMDDWTFLEKEQIEVLKQFFRNFTDDHDSRLKQRFLQLWNKIGDIYSDYRERLLSQGIAYEGLLYRSVIEGNALFTADTASPSAQKYIFVGFNLLNDVEQKLFAMVKQSSDAFFYWDFDHYYLTDNEAGRFIKEHLQQFPNELPTDHPTYSTFTKQKDVTFISSPTEDLQARYIHEWLTPERINAGRKTAIVLADESLLETVLHCLPESVEHVNITTGYPLAQTSVASLVSLVAQMLQRSTYKLRTVNPILRHPLARYISSGVDEVYATINKQKIFYPTLDDLCVVNENEDETLRYENENEDENEDVNKDENLLQLFTPLRNTNDCTEINQRLIWLVKLIAQRQEEQSPLISEALFRMYTILNRLAAQPLEQWSFSLYQKLITQIIQTTTIPFHGEPIIGIQVMGILETRNLDFDHLLLLSCNEGKLPAKVSDSSFIPHSIRKSFGLTTIDNKVAIYAYYFHRLLQRANDIEVTYNSSTSDTQSGEMSRFMLQMLAESPLKISRKALKPGQGEATREAETVVEKTDEMLQQLIDKGFFSPSALGSFLRCPMKFYFKHILGISDNKDDDEEEMDAKAFGDIFHRAAELLYTPFIGKQVTKGIIEDMLKPSAQPLLMRYIDQAFREILFNLKDSSRPTPRMGGLQILNREMVHRFLLKLLRYDLRNAPFIIEGLEHKAYGKVVATTPFGEKTFTVGGIIDRLDICDDTIRIIDYKTGRYEKLTIKDIPTIFSLEKMTGHADYFLQAMLYSCIIRNSYSTVHKVMPMLLYPVKADSPDFSPKLSVSRQPIDDIMPLREEFMDNIRQLIEHILDKNTPFHRCADTKQCTNCPFRNFC